MLIHLPQSALYHSIKLFVHLPEGFDNFTSHVSVANGVDEIVLSDGCPEEFVEVTARFTDHRSLPVGDIMVLKEAKHEEKFDEDDPVEADEKVDSSPSAEVVDEAADKKVKPVDLSKKSRNRRNRRNQTHSTTE